MMTFYNPWRTLTSELDWPSRNSAEATHTSAAFSPRVDIVEQKDHYRIDIDLPGVEAKDVSVTVEQNVLSISGDRKIEKQDETEGYYRFERSRGSFLRSFQLPEDVDPENISAVNKNGVLTVQIPKAEVAKPRSIEVKTLS